MRRKVIVDLFFMLMETERMNAKKNLATVRITEDTDVFTGYLTPDKICGKKVEFCDLSMLYIGGQFHLLVQYQYSSL